MAQFWNDNFWAPGFWADGFWVGMTTGSAPDTPSGSNGAIRDTTIVGNGSLYHDPDGNTHVSTDWELDILAGDFSVPVAYSYVDTSNKTSFTWSGLDPETEYKWRFRYRDGTGRVSAYSAAVPATTIAAQVGSSGRQRLIGGNWIVRKIQRPSPFVLYE